MKNNSSPYVLFGIDFGDNEEQKELIKEINEDCNRKPVVYCLGSSGTGKTFTALAASLSLVRGKGSKKKYKNIFYVREPVEIGHRLGYLKGTAEDKYAPYLGGLLDNYNHLMENVRKEANFSEPLRKNKKIQLDDDCILPLAYQKLPSDIIPLAPEFLRGRSFKDCIIIVDEAQNLSLNEIQTIVTRIGPFTKLIMIGSSNQIDVPEFDQENNPFLLSYKILESSGLVGFVELKKPMRSSFVTEFDSRFVEYKNKTMKKN